MDVDLFLQRGALIATIGGALGYLVNWLTQRRSYRREAAGRTEDSGPARLGASLAAPTGSLPTHVRGRSHVLRLLRRAVRRPPGRMQVLVGMGGVGKSTVALDLYRWAAGRRSAWWVSAQDYGSVTDGLVSLACALGANDVDVAAIRAWTGAARDRLWELLDQARPGWLLVFDNADDLNLLLATGALDGQGWLRPSNRGLVLVTSRIRDDRLWGSDAEVHEINLLTAMDAAQVLMDAAPGGGDEAGARVLAHRLGYLPLVLQLAGANLSSRFARWGSFDDYRRALDHVGVVDGLAGNSLAMRDPRAVVMDTWELSLDSLAIHGVPHARPLLRLLSRYAAGSPIPTRLLRARPMRHLLAGDQAGGAGPAHRPVDAALRALAELSLVDERRLRIGVVTESAVVVHPLVAETNRAHLDNAVAATTSSMGTVHRTAVELVAAMVEPLRSDDNRDWPWFEALAPHVRELLASTARHLDQDHLAGLLAAAANIVAFHAWSGYETTGEQLAASALEHADRLGADHPAILRLRHERAWTVGRHGRWAEAATQLRQVLDARVRTLGAEHPHTLDTLHKLGWATGKLGDWQAAETQLGAVRDVRIRLLGEEHPDTLHTLCCLAWAAGQQGRLDEAEDAYHHVIAVRSWVLGEDHVETWDARHSLAEAFVLNGRHVDAETLLRRIIAARIRTIGQEHPETLASRPRYWLALALRGQGRHQLAKTELERLFTDQVRALGPNHPATLETSDQLSRSAASGRQADSGME